jgi:hypothetical protein
MRLLGDGWFLGVDHVRLGDDWLLDVDHGDLDGFVLGLMDGVIDGGVDGLAVEVVGGIGEFGVGGAGLVLGRGDGFDWLGFLAVEVGEGGRIDQASTRVMCIYHWRPSTWERTSTSLDHVLEVDGPDIAVGIGVGQGDVDLVV